MSGACELGAEVSFPSCGCKPECTDWRESVCEDGRTWPTSGHSEIAAIPKHPGCRFQRPPLINVDECFHVHPLQDRQHSTLRGRVLLLHTQSRHRWPRILWPPGRSPHSTGVMAGGSPGTGRPGREETDHRKSARGGTGLQLVLGRWCCHPETPEHVAGSQEKYLLFSTEIVKHQGKVHLSSFGFQRAELCNSF